MAIVMVMSIGVVAASAADIGYTDPVTMSAGTVKVFSGVSRVKSTSNAMVANTTHGGTKPGYAKLNGNPITNPQAQFLEFNCVKTSAASTKCCNERYIIDDIRRTSAFNPAASSGNYYLWLRNASSASTIDCRMTWTPS